MNLHIKPGGYLRGYASVAADKSISHRVAILSLLANGCSHISNFLEAEDTLATLAAITQLGATVTRMGVGRYEIHSPGLSALKPQTLQIDCGNSGTAMRLLAGLLAGIPGQYTLSGDQQLSKRPMQRIITPLRMMGADITAQAGCPPLVITGGALTAIDYRLPIASSQVKSACLLAALTIRQQAISKIEQPQISRDHTERLLQRQGVELRYKNKIITLTSPAIVKPLQLTIPNDLSAAAFFMVAACITEGADIILPGVGINPTRSGILHILNNMGANIQLLRQRIEHGEVVADLRIRYATLTATPISKSLIPLAIDEFPALFIAFARARGVTKLHGLKELTVKESNRLTSMAAALTCFGVNYQLFDDGIHIQGQSMPFNGGVIDAQGDHRIAMAGAIAGNICRAPLQINNCQAIATSFPTFLWVAKQLGLRLNTQ